MAPGHVFPAVNPKLYICVSLSGLLASRMRILDGFVRIAVVVSGIVGYVAICLPFRLFWGIFLLIPFISYLSLDCHERERVTPREAGEKKSVRVSTTRDAHCSLSAGAGVIPWLCQVLPLRLF